MKITSCPVLCYTILLTYQNDTFDVYTQVLVPPTGNVYDVLTQDPHLTVLADLLKSSKLADTLQGAGPFTIFAPTNEVKNEAEVYFILHFFHGYFSFLMVTSDYFFPFQNDVCLLLRFGMFTLKLTLAYGLACLR